MWWLSGITRDVALILRPPAHIRDYAVRTQMTSLPAQTTVPPTPLAGEAWPLCSSGITGEVSVDVELRQLKALDGDLGSAAAGGEGCCDAQAQPCSGRLGGETRSPSAQKWTMSSVWVSCAPQECRATHSVFAGSWLATSRQLSRRLCSLPEC